MLRLLWRWPIFIPGLILGGLFLYITELGFRGTGDSIHYLWAARSWRESKLLLAPEGGLYRFWGPLYPLVLSWCFSPAAVRLLHGAALLVHLACWMQMGRWLMPVGRVAVVALGLALAVSTALLVPAGFIWSETVFEALAAVYLLTLLAWCRTRNSNWLGVATAVGFLLPLQRTSGFFLLVGAGAGLLFTGQLRGHWGRLLLHWVGCVAGGLAWNYYAEVLAGPPPAYAPLQEWSLFSLMADYGFVLTRWFVPLGATWLTMVPTFWALAVLVVLYVAFPFKEHNLKGTATGYEPLTPRTQGLRLLWWVVLITLAAQVAAAWAGRAGMGPHNAERYSAVLVGPVYLLLLARWSVITNSQRKERVSAVLICLWLAYSAVRVGHNAHQQRQRVPMAWPVSSLLGKNTPH